MRQLFSELQAAGYEATFQYEGITVMFGLITIVFGNDDEAGLFTSYLQQDLPSGSAFTSDEGLTKDAALELCRRYASTASVAA